MMCTGRNWRTLSVVLVTAVVWFSPARSSAADVYPPAPTRYFNDYANVTSKATQNQLDAELHKFEEDTSNQVVVAIFPKMQSTSSVDDYSIHLFQAWKLGQKNKDNGVGLFVYVQDRQMFISTGYGLEGALPDATCKMIIENDIKPRFKAGDFDGGLRAGVTSILQATRGEYKGTGHAGTSGPQIPPWLPPVLFFLFILLMQYLSRRFTSFGRGGRSSGWYLGGGWGGSGGGWSSGGGGGGGGGFSSGGGSTGGGGAGGSW